MILFSNMRFIVMFVTAVCVLFLIKLRWPKRKNFYDTIKVMWITAITNHVFKNKLLEATPTEDGYLDLQT